jgi:phosphate transport system permease protein
MGATKWQVIYKHLLPYSAGGIATGVIIAVSRALGETAPLLLIGVIGTWRVLPTSPVNSRFPFVNMHWLGENYSTIPILMYNWLDEAERVLKEEKAAAAGFVLIVLTLALNSAAMYIRYRVRKNIHW